jgi:hypothetical protein
LDTETLKNFIRRVEVVEREGFGQVTVIIVDHKVIEVDALIKDRKI